MEHKILFDAEVDVPAGVEDKLTEVITAALSAEGQSFLEQLIANQVNYGKEEGTDASTDAQDPTDTDPADTQASDETQTPADTQAPTDTKAPAGEDTKAPATTEPVAEGGCASTVGVAAVAVLMAAAAFVARKKD